jgi:nicotinamidase/pyrazinamidase
VKIISKSTTPEKETYSGFEGTNLEEELEKHKIKRVFVGGLATEYCVKNTVLDSLKLGYSTYLLEDATLGVNLQPDDNKQAIEEMVRKGSKKITLSHVNNLLRLKNYKN